MSGQRSQIANCGQNICQDFAFQISGRKMSIAGDPTSVFQIPRSLFRSLQIALRFHLVVKEEPSYLVDNFLRRDFQAVRNGGYSPDKDQSSMWFQNSAGRSSATACSMGALGAVSESLMPSNHCVNDF